MNKTVLIGVAFLVPILMLPAFGEANNGSLEGYVTDAETGVGIYGALVRVEITEEYHITLATTTGGYYIFDHTLPVGSGYGLTVVKQHYETYHGECPEITSGMALKNVALAPVPTTGTLAGTVYDTFGDPMPGVNLTISTLTRITDADGRFSVRLPAGSNHTLTARARNYEIYIAACLTVTAGDTTVHDVDLTLGIVDAYAGADQWGESRISDGILTTGDRDEMITQAQTGAGDYSLCFTPYPLIQDLDGDNVVTASDVAVMDQWVNLDFSGVPATGVPDRIVLSDPPAEIDADGTKVIRVVVENSLTGNPRAGWGTVFEIDAELSTCDSARIAGRPFPTIVGSGHEFFHEATAVFNYSATNGLVSLLLSAEGCEVGDTIAVRVFIPGDSEAGIFGDRFPDRLTADELFLLEVVQPGGGPVCFFGTLLQ